MQRWLAILAVLAAVGFLVGFFSEDAETDPTQVNRIAAVYLAGDAEKAAGEFEALTGKGVVYRTRKDYPAAEAMYLKALEYAKRGYELDPSDATIAANYAVALHYAGSFEERDRLTQRAEELGYKKLDRLQSIYAGDLDVHD